MKDKEWKTNKKKVQAIFDKWIRLMGLRWYNIDLVWKPGDSPRKDDGFRALMRVSSRWEYRTAMVTIWLEEMAELDDEEMEKHIVHELCHIYLQPLRHDEFDVEKEEYVVESLARAFIWVRNNK